MALVTVTKSCLVLHASGSVRLAVMGHKRLFGFLIAVGHSVALLDSRNLLFQARGGRTSYANK